jgi:hypothetical protein
MVLPGAGHIFSLANNPFAHSNDLSLIGFNQEQQKNSKYNTLKDNRIDVLSADDHILHQNNYFSIDGSGPFFSEMMHFARRHPYQVSVIFSVIIALVIVSSCLIRKQVVDYLFCLIFLFQE